MLDCVSRWATCLTDGDDGLDTPNELKHERFGSAPGAVWTAKMQCEVGRVLLQLANGQD